MVYFNLFQFTPITSYDALYRLKEATGREKIGINGTQNNPYDDAYHTAVQVQIKNGQQVQNYKQYYSYDEGNNLTKIQQTLGSTFTREITISGSTNRGADKSLAPTPDQVAQFYDLNGNMIKMEHLQSLTWDYRNMISSVTKGTDTEVYNYNASGNRVRKITKYSGRTD